MATETQSGPCRENKRTCAVTGRALIIVVALVLFVVINLALSGIGLYLWQRPKRIPSSPSSEVRSAISKLRSQDPVTKAEGADSVSGGGVGALFAVPHLIPLLEDQTALKRVWTFDGHPASVFDEGEPTSAYKEAEKALRIILVHDVDLLDHRDLERYVVAPGDVETRSKVLVLIRRIIEARQCSMGLVSGLSDPDPLVRRIAAKALGRKCGLSQRDIFGDWHKPISALISSLNDAELQVRKAAEESLSKITGQQFGPDAKEWRNWLSSGYVNSRLRRFPLHLLRPCRWILPITVLLLLPLNLLRKQKDEGN